jgi:hypothetical protein
MLEEKDIELIRGMFAEFTQTLQTQQKPSRKTVKKTPAKKKAVNKSRVKKAGRPPKKVMDNGPTSDIIDEPIRLKPSTPIGGEVSIVDRIQKGKGSPGRTEPFTPVKNRPNLFLDSDICNMHKNDTIIDKKLNHNVQPIPRRSKTKYCIVNCLRCGTEYTLPLSSISIDESGCHQFVCNNCLARKG